MDGKEGQEKEGGGTRKDQKEQANGMYNAGKIFRGKGTQAVIIQDFNNLTVHMLKPHFQGLICHMVPCLDDLLGVGSTLINFTAFP